MSQLDEILQRIAGLSAEDRAKLERDTLTATAGMYFVPNEGPQSIAYESKADQIGYGGEVGGGKLLPLDARLPTPFGWVAMGDVRPGLRLFDETGAICTVTQIHPVEALPELYRLTFDDKSSIECCADHLWHTFTFADLAAMTRRDDDWRERRRLARPSRATGKRSAAFTAAVTARNKRLPPEAMPAPTGAVRSTREIVATLRTNRGACNHAVAVAGPLDLPAADLPIDPYVLGVWLGDGTAISAQLTSADPEIWQEIERRGYVVTHHRHPHSHWIRGLQGDLRSIHMLGRKHIPPAYLRASAAQRLDLLRGLMDTDGTVARSSGSAEFCNTNEAIIDGVYELIVSLGWKVAKREGVARLNGRVIGRKWTLKWMPSECVFLLPRKAALQGIARRRTQRFRYITAAERIPSRPGRCITVDSRNHLYLAGSQMVPTHNTLLILGSALQKHKKSLIMRRMTKEVPFLVERAQELVGHKQGYNGQDKRWRLPGGRVIQFGGALNPGDERGYKGDRKDLIALDEATEFLESQVDFLIGWLGSTDPDQHCQLILPSNPPASADGEWYIRWFAPWLDPTHPLYKTEDGVLLYCMPVPGSSPTLFEWRDAPFTKVIEGKLVRAISRTFVRSELEDNPDLARTGYGERLGNMPEHLRRRYLAGDFTAGMVDRPNQVIPTAWVTAAQSRWREDGGKDEPMSAIAVDPSDGGPDPAAKAVRRGGWFGRIETLSGEAAADGASMAAWVLASRRNSCPVVVDVGGGYAGKLLERLKDNGVPHVAFNGANTSNERTREKALRFRNRRAAALWKLREELDPDQEGGSVVALPPDPELLGDLTAPTYKVSLHGIQIEAKEELRKRLGRSTNKGDAVAMALAEGNRAVQRIGRVMSFSAAEQGRDMDMGRTVARPQVVMGHQSARRSARGMH